MNYTGLIVDIKGQEPGTWRQFIRDGRRCWENVDTGEQTEWADGRDMSADDLRGVMEGRPEEDDVNAETANISTATVIGNGITLGSVLVNTAIDEGGCTLEVRNLERIGPNNSYLSYRDPGHKTGYYIGGTGEGLEFTEDNVNFLQIAGWLARQSEANIKDGTSWLVGSWIEDGTIYLDLTVHAPDLDEALALGRKHNQISIWDIANDTAIYC